MINQIILFSIKNKLIVGLFTVAIAISGLWSITKVPLDAVPDITNNQVQVITQAPNLATEDIEQFVTYPVEIAMANLPSVTEIRSISRFGLSVVTIVFEDDMGTYLPRQLVGEKLIEVKEEIPDKFGTPEIGPISTGLGEIYQYTLTVDKEYRDKYSSSDLRTMQDWIVRRQMAMVPGVVEVNAVGGDIKQYEIAVSPEQLNSMNVSIIEVFNALKANNENTGGAYIEKNHQANFIRGEGLIRGLSDIEKIVVKSVNGIPIKIKDVATVQYGKAIRYGALTQDGEGEVVGGMVMMLKGANSNDVIEDVKERVEKIQKSLPVGVNIEPLLDRSKLISKTTSTVSVNLLEGALIVIFILVFLLGNWRSGIIVASTIPLSLLFAFILMNYFGVWANLMSLGAIDFGIIIDGAVIIVESTVFLFHSRINKNIQLNPALKDEIAYNASSKMMNAAFFGQLIILIVFVPILALEGVEGKMFKPMALTFMFAMVGVMILCLTYVPMMCSWFTSVSIEKKLTKGDKFIAFVESKYEKFLIKSLSRSKLVISLSLILLAFSFIVFTKMGGEFIPQLDEGDIAFHTILKPGSSLTESIESTTKVEKRLKDKFPEIEKIVSRIGVADVPTDPMPMDIADCFIILKPENEWVTTDSKEELIELMKTTVEQIPGLNYEFTQPIEMRFNELLEGVREDVAIKLYGDDINLLASKAEEVSRIIAGTEGIGDMKVEATTGLPQMTIKYNRDKIAQYGVNIEDLNTVVQSSFAGKSAGVIFEKERRFDMVVRLKKDFRTSIEDLADIYIHTANHSRVPLRELASIEFQPGPMQISRDNTNRRVYVGINVRGRDVKSLVEEIRDKLDKEFVLPPGYFIRYGGAFENLERASNRLKMVVPIALASIFLLIFFALRSLKQSVMIFMAIPLAAIGGVVSLWLRDMPFSISAGVGFIVLFGVAVLNGLVLISGWNELKEEGISDINERIKLGAKRRIRPILLTALTDILGFLPMALSSSAGAEVQRPLATVVIGGMLSATLLTLFVIPILYRWFESGTTIKVNSKVLALIIVGSGSFIFSGNDCLAQENAESTVIVNLEQALKIGLENNIALKSSKVNISLLEQEKKGVMELDKTDFNLQYGQMNSFENDLSIEVNQNFSFPTVYSKLKKLSKEKVTASSLEYKLVEDELKMNIKSAWYQLVYLKEREYLLKYQDSLYQKYLDRTLIRYKLEEATLLEKVVAESKLMEVRNELKMNLSDIRVQEVMLCILLNNNNLKIEPSGSEKARNLSDVNGDVMNNSAIAISTQAIKVAEAEKELSSSEMLPDISVGYFNQSMIGSNTISNSISGMSDRFSGFQIGLSIPIFYGSYKSDIKEAKINVQIHQLETQYFAEQIKGDYMESSQEVLKYQTSLDYYESQALPQAELILNNAQKSFDSGAISYIEYFQNIDQALELKFNYLTTLNGYNQSIVRIEYLLGL